MDSVQLTANMIAAFSGVQVLFLFAKLFSVCLVQQDLYAFFFFSAGVDFNCGNSPQEFGFSFELSRILKLTLACTYIAIVTRNTMQFHRTDRTDI